MPNDHESDCEFCAGIGIAYMKICSHCLGSGKQRPRERAPENPTTIHEAILCVKAAGSTLTGIALRHHAILTFPHVAPKTAARLKAESGASS